MKSISASLALIAYCAWLPSAAAQPLAKPLADFDKMVSELRTGSVVGEPIRAGNTTVIPFAAVQFGLGSAGAAAAGAGGLGAKTIPLGVVVVEGDDVRVESLPYREEKPSATMHQLIQGIIDRKVSFMVNGINLGNTPGSASDLAPMIAALTGQTTVMVNGLNLGNLNTPRPAAPDKDTIANLEAAAARSPTAEAYCKLGDALRKANQKARALAAYQRAMQIRPDYADAVRAAADLNK